MSQKLLQYIEIDVDYCSLNYSVAPCTASLAESTIGSSLLLHMTGTSGSQVFTDASPAAHGNATVGGAAQISTAQTKFGGGSGIFTAGGDYLRFPNHSDWEFGSGPFTVDWWEYRLAGASNSGVISRDASTVYQAFLFGYDAGSVAQTYMSSSGSSWDVVNGMSLGTIDFGSWHHRAVVRSGNNFYGFKDGVIVGTATSSLALQPASSQLNIGGYWAPGSTAPNFHLQELRISKGVARWTANFTPPTKPYSLINKCFNTIATCQDRANFTNAPVTLRFAVPTDYLPQTIECIPDIKTIQFDPAVISLGKDLGQRATLTVSFDDHRHSDTGAGFDKYLSDRTYDPYKQGTFWGKFRARQPFVRGRPLRWITGDTDQALSEMETRHYIIESTSGPDNNGIFKIIAKDVLKLADGDRAMAPVVSEGYLVGDITAAATTLTLSPSGIGATYPASGYANLGGSEIVSFTRVDSPPSDVMTITRAQLGTVASDHKAQDRVQLCIRYSAQSPELILADLLENYAAVPSAFIPLADWTTEVEAHLRRLYTATIAQPTAVNTLISELIEQAGLSMWWNDRDQEIGLMVLHGMVYTNYSFSEQNIIADTLQITEQPDKRISQVHTYFGQINPLTSLTDKANYRSASVIADLQSETDYGSAAIKEIFSRWIPQLGRTIADRLGTILLGRFKDPPRKLSFSSLRNSTTSEIILANGYQVQSWPLQTDTGENETVNVQVTRLRPNPDLIEIESEEVLFQVAAEDLTTRHIIVDANNHNLNIRSAHDDIFPAPEAGNTIVVTINPGVMVGSTSTAANALDIGTWPAGVIIVLHVQGRIEGHGGEGGGLGINGTGGGPALFTRVPIKLSTPVGGGQIWGGGGGGAGAFYQDGSGTQYFWGGGGGAGFDPGGPGAQNQSASNQSTPGTPDAGGIGYVYAGEGGGPGLPGGPSDITQSGAAGGAGIAIDGVSFITSGSWDGTTFTPGPQGGDIRGSQVN